MDKNECRSALKCIGATTTRPDRLQGVHSKFGVCPGGLLETAEHARRRIHASCPWVANAATENMSAHYEPTYYQLEPDIPCSCL